MKVKYNSGYGESSGMSLSSSFKHEVGKVFYSIMDDHTPSKEIFEEYGDWASVGTIFYLPYPRSRDVSDIDIRNCSTAKPLLSYQKHIPLKEELVIIFELPAYYAQTDNTSTEKYYLSTINLWNNNHHNANPTNELKLGNNYKELTNINSLLPFEGDLIFESRNGAGLRFGNTQRFNNVENFWSATGQDGDPITLLVNGHRYDPDTFKPYVENINVDASSIYLTKSQVINLDLPDIVVNPLTQTILPSKYLGAQIVLSSDKVSLNSRDDINLFAKTNIDMYANEIITLNPKESLIIKSPRIFIGMDKDSLPTEPVLLGNKTIDNYSDVLDSLLKFAVDLTSVVSTPAGTPILQITAAANQLQVALLELMKDLDKLKSKTAYVAN